MEASVDESKTFSLIPEKVTFELILLLLQLFIDIQIFNFVVLSVIIAPHNVVTVHISKTHLPIFPLNVLKLELN